MTQEVSDRERPPESVVSNLPKDGADGDLFAASGWGSEGAVYKIGPDDVVGGKSEIVRKDDEEAYRDGWR